MCWFPLKHGKSHPAVAADTTTTTIGDDNAQHHATTGTSLETQAHGATIPTPRTVPLTMPTLQAMAYCRPALPHASEPWRQTPLPVPITNNLQANAMSPSLKSPPPRAVAAHNNPPLAQAQPQQPQTPLHVAFAENRAPSPQPQQPLPDTPPPATRYTATTTGDTATTPGIDAVATAAAAATPGEEKTNDSDHQEPPPKRQRLLSCEEHRKFRRGLCKVCRGCNLCPPPESCPIPEEHDRIASLPRIAQPTYITPFTAEQLERKRKRASQCEQHKRSKCGSCKECGVCIRCPGLESCPVADKHRQRSRTRTPQGIRILTNVPLDSTKGVTLRKVLELLNIPLDHLEDIPIVGVANVNEGSVEYKKAKNVFNLVTDAVSKLLVQKDDDASVLKDNINREVRDAHEKSTKQNEVLTKNVVKLSFFGIRRYSVVSQCILATSMKHHHLRKLLHDEYEKLDETQKSQVNPIRHSMSFHKHATLRNKYEEISQGKDLPQHNTRIPPLDAAKVSATMDFLQEALVPKEGGRRRQKLKVEDQVFKNVPVYEEVPFKPLFGMYKATFPKEERFGIGTFTKLYHMMIK
jgi:hypothetical protein